jgi:hypothetical protein
MVRRSRRRCEPAPTITCPRPAAFTRRRQLRPNGALTIPVPGDAGDVGNWLQPLGVVALITQGIVIILAAIVLLTIHRPARLVSLKAPLV